MDIDPGDRIINTQETKRTFGWLPGLFFVLLFLSGLSYMVLDVFRDRIPPYSVPFFKVSPTPFADVYSTLHVAPLSFNLENTKVVTTGLTKLRREPCDLAAIFQVTEAVANAHEERMAANMLEGFAAKCPNGSGNLRRAADFLFQIGDNERAHDLMQNLVQQYPDNANFWYFKGKIEASQHMYDEALISYANTTHLLPQAEVGKWVFTEMAEIYVALQRYCQAIDPTK